MCSLGLEKDQAVLDPEQREEHLDLEVVML